MLKFIDQLKREDLAGKKVLLRVDFDVPVTNGKITGDFRIKSHIETINYLLENGAKILLASHINAVDSFGPLVEEIGHILNQTLTLVPLSELPAIDLLFHTSSLLLLDNLRQDPREEQNDETFARILSKDFDIFVNDAFAVCHRNHASITAIAKNMPSFGGFLIKKETERLSEAIKAPAEGKILVMGGAKISTKLPVIKNFLDKAEKILIGGALANNFFKSRRFQIGSSLFDETGLDAGNDPKILLPVDVRVTNDRSGGGESAVLDPFDKESSVNIKSGEAIVDIGVKTAQMYSDIILKSKLVIWNGTMGINEVDLFTAGTNAIADSVAAAGNSIIGGGDTVAAVNKLGLLDKISFVSTGGGAMLEFLAGERLPGLEALNHYNL